MSIPRLLKLGFSSQWTSINGQPTAVEKKKTKNKKNNLFQADKQRHNIIPRSIMRFKKSTICDRIALTKHGGWS